MFHYSPALVGAALILALVPLLTLIPPPCVLPEQPRTVPVIVANQTSMDGLSLAVRPSARSCAGLTVDPEGGKALSRALLPLAQPILFGLNLGFAGYLPQSPDGGLSIDLPRFDEAYRTAYWDGTPLMLSTQRRL